MIAIILPTFGTKDVALIEVEQAVELPLLLDAKEDVELIFFGYAGCLDVCTPRLHNISTWYSALSTKQQAHIGVKFFDLSVPKDETVPDIFAKSFHSDFQGIYLDSNTIRDYTKLFTVYFANSLTRSGEMDHTSHLYIIKRSKEKKELRLIYTAYPYDYDSLNKAVQRLLDE